MYLSFNSFRLFNQAVGKFKVVVYPPLWSAFDISCVYVETATEPLEYCFMLLLNLLHKQLLSRRTHCNKNNVGLLFNNVGYYSFFVFFGLDVSVAVTHNVYSLKLFFKFFYSLFNGLLLAANEIERFLFVEFFCDFEPKFTTGYFADFLLSLSFQGQNGSRAVAITDIRIYYLACVVVGVKNLFGIYGNKNTLFFVYIEESIRRDLYDRL